MAPDSDPIFINKTLSGSRFSPCSCVLETHEDLLCERRGQGLGFSRFWFGFLRVWFSRSKEGLRHPQSPGALKGRRRPAQDPVRNPAPHSTTTSRETTPQPAHIRISHQVARLKTGVPEASYTKGTGRKYKPFSKKWETLSWYNWDRSYCHVVTGTNEYCLKRIQHSLVGRVDYCIIYSNA